MFQRHVSVTRRLPVVSRMNATSTPATAAAAAAAAVCPVQAASVKAQETGPTTYNAGSREYQALPAGFAVERVVVVHRHGDRAQISRRMGPAFAEESHITDFWKTKMPAQDSIHAMSMAFQSSRHVTTSIVKKGTASDGLSGSSASVSVAHTEDEHFYSGEDADQWPYAQLTELGSQQLQAIGRLLRSRYGGNGDSSSSGSIISGDATKAADEVYLRSTNMCRTLQSLRSLVAGLYQLSPEEADAGAAGSELFEAQQLMQASALQVDTRPRRAETMFAHPNCQALRDRREQILPASKIHTSFENYEELHSRIKGQLRLTMPEDQVVWVMLKEVLTCYKVHGHPLPLDFTYEDEKVATDISGWLWGTLFRDEVVSRLAIGRFVKELLRDIDSSTGANASASASPNETVFQEAAAAASAVAATAQKKMLIYSGHDSTLVPLMCALGLYDNQWPPYASYLVLEIVAKKGTGGEGDTRYVRALYNDEVRPLFGEADLLPYDEFEARLQGVLITEEEYSAACEKSP